jgi:hypothetical protein
MAKSSTESAAVRKANLACGFAHIEGTPGIVANSGISVPRVARAAGAHPHRAVPPGAAPLILHTTTGRQKMHELAGIARRRR